MRGVTCHFDFFSTFRTFLLTRLMRGVTTTRKEQKQKHTISTHTPHARRDPSGAPQWLQNFISTHTPHARRDRLQYLGRLTKCKFLLTRLMRGVTTRLSKFSSMSRNFYSHASCEA